MTRRAIRTLQRRAGLNTDGRLDRRTRAALGPLGRPVLGTRVIARDFRGLDVAALQFLLATHGFPSGPFDGALGPRTEGALRRFQAWAQLTVDGTAGHATILALRSQPPPLSPRPLAWPVRGRLGSHFGPRRGRFHAGIDIGASEGSLVTAAAAGRVVWAGWRNGGWGKLITVAHGGGVRTMYAHLSGVRVRLGQSVARGETVGLVGRTGATRGGAHLHFEVRVRSAAVDPLSALRDVRNAGGTAWPGSPRE